ncbi:hypothetical protein IG631_16171 [Alternaria alternata]|nr:hypothetical protein IG631_16171 [Alternaria alternata]
MISQRIQGQKSLQPQQLDTEGLIANATAHPFVRAPQLYPGRESFLFPNSPCIARGRSTSETSKRSVYLKGRVSVGNFAWSKQGH